MAKAAATCAALGGAVLLSATVLASIQMQTTLPLWDLSPDEVARLARARWSAACNGAQGLFSNGAAPVPGRLAAVLLQARYT